MSGSCVDELCWCTQGSREKIAQIKRSLRPKCLSVLASSFSAEVHTAKASYFHNKINSTSDTRNLFKTLNSLLCPPPPPPTTSLTADDFATFFTNETRSISSQVSAPHMQELKPTTSTAKTPLFAFCPFTEAEVSNFSSPATLQHALLIKSPHTFSKQSLLHSYQQSHTSSTYLSLQAPAQLHSSRLG